jgi:hypothetical protein
MKTLDLNACGVSEMNDVEMREVDGGKITFMDFIGILSLSLMIGVFILCMSL